MKNLKKWFDSHSNQTKILLAIGFSAHVVYALYSMKDYGYIISQYGFSSYIGRALGIFFGVFGPVLIISMVISIIPYFIFRRVAEKYKKYLDYLSIIFIIVSCIIFYFSFKAQNNIYY